MESHGVSVLFLIHGSLMASIALIVFTAIPYHHSGDNPHSKDKQSLSLSAVLNSHKQAWKSPTIAAPAFGWLFYTITFVALLSILPGLMASEDRAFTAAALPIASIGSSLTLGVLLLRWISAVMVVCIGFAMAIPFAVALLILPTEPLVCIGLFAALGLVQGATFASIPQLNSTNQDRALANGTLAQAGNLGNLCGTPLLLTVVIVGSMEAVSVLIVSCYILAITTHYYFARKRHHTV